MIENTNTNTRRDERRRARKRYRESKTRCRKKRGNEDRASVSHHHKFRVWKLAKKAQWRATRETRETARWCVINTVQQVRHLREPPKLQNYDVDSTPTDKPFVDSPRVHKGAQQPFTESRLHTPSTTAAVTVPSVALAFTNQENQTNRSPTDQYRTCKQSARVWVHI